MHTANMAQNRDWKKHWKGETRNWRTMKSRPRKRICNETRTKRNNSNKNRNSRSGSSSNKRKRKRSRKEQGEEEQKGKIVKCVPWIVYRLWYFLTLLFQDVVQLHPTCRPPSLLAHLGNTVLDFSAFSTCYVSTVISTRRCLLPESHR